MVDYLFIDTNIQKSLYKEVEQNRKRIEQYFFKNILMTVNFMHCLE